MTTIDERIVDRYPRLSPQERRAADTLLDHLDDLATYRATELARLAGVSKATMSRLFRRLGYRDFEGVREQLRDLRTSGFPVAVAPAAGLFDRLQQEVSHLQRVYGSLDEHVVDEVAKELVAAQRVVVIGQRSGYPAALAFRTALAQVRPAVALVPQPGQSLSEDLIGLGSGDIAVVVSFRRHHENISEVLRLLAAASVPVLLLADPTARSHASQARWWVECPLASAGAFDSHATAMSLVAMLADRVMDQLPAAQQRIEQIDRSYQRLREIEAR